MWHDPFSSIASFAKVGMINFLSNAYHSTGLSRIFKNPMILFIYGIFSKWYVLVMVSCLVVTYYVLKGLNDLGLIEIAYRTVFDGFSEAKSVAKNCVPRILDFKSFWHCLQNPPSYEPSQEEEAITNQLNRILRTGEHLKPPAKNPYE